MIMGRKVDPEKRIMQKSIGFYFYQQRFFAKHPDFKPDKFCRDAVNEQIKLIDPEFIEEEEKHEETKDI